MEKKYFDPADLKKIWKHCGVPRKHGQKIL